MNGSFLPLDEAMVPIEDRGFQLGDGVYEVVMAFEGKLFLAEQHLARLRRSLEGIGLDYDLSANPLMPVMTEGLRRNNLRDALVYIQITRGVAPRQHRIPECAVPTVVLTFRPAPRVSQEVRQRGLRVMTTPDIRWAHCYIKAITLLPNVLAKTDACRKGFDDAIFVTQSGEVREATSANIFMLRDGTLWTPPRDKGVLHGITQAVVIDCARAAELNVQEQAFCLDDLLGADEVFLSGSTIDLLGVTQVDDGRIGDGRVGATTKRLAVAFRERIALETG